MELGQKLKQARLEKGLSQRQLCEGIITRNMLSQIESGTAKPSLATLQALCARLGKPASYFTGEAPSENLALLHRAEQAAPAEAMEMLKDYLSPDPILDRWYGALMSRCCLKLAEQALAENRVGYAGELLRTGMAYKPEDTDIRPWLLLQYAAGTADAQTLARALPDNTRELMLRGEAALSGGEPDRCLAFLEAADSEPPELLWLKAEALLEKKAYREAAECFCAIEESDPGKIYPRLEQCYRELGDYEKAYYYACKQR